VVVIGKRLTTLCLAALSLICFASATSGQVDKRHEVYPEVDIWIRTAPDQQVYLFAPYMESLDDDYHQVGIGAMYSWSFDQNNLAMFDWLAARENSENFRNFTARVGYYYAQSLGDGGAAYTEQYIPAELHIRAYSIGGILITDRNRIEIGKINSANVFRYRNRLTIERQFKLVDQIRITPYANIEASFDSRYDTFNRIKATVGAKLPIFSFFSIDGYYAFSNDTRSSIQNKHGAGLTLNLYIEPKDIFN
jgi:hypothetical protein